MNVEFRFNIGDQVTVKRTPIKGVVMGNFIGRHGNKEAMVEYADGHAVMRREYVVEEDLVSWSAVKP